MNGDKKKKFSAVDVSKGEERTNCTSAAKDSSLTISIKQISLHR